MSEPIIIETPTTTRERLVLVPPDAVSRTEGGDELLTIRTANARDATPADLERGGYVPLAAQPDPGTLQHLRADLRDAVKERDEAESHAEMRARILTVRAEKAERERDEARRLHSDAEAQVACRNELRAQVAAAEGRFRAAEAERDTLRAELARLTAPAEGSCWACREELGVAHERARHARNTDAVYRERDILAALAAKLAQRLGYRAWTAEHDLKADPTWEPEWKDIVLFHLPTGQCSWHLKAGEKAECGLDSLPVAVETWDGHTTEEKYARILAFLSSPDERARQQPEKDRATDEELADLYRKVYETHGGGTISVSHDDCRRAAILAVAARVRQERCLVAQAVAADCDVHVTEQISGGWLVRVVAQTSSTAAGVSATVPRADVPATLARLLGEVSRG